MVTRMSGCASQRTSLPGTLLLPVAAGERCGKRSTNPEARLIWSRQSAAKGIVTPGDVVPHAAGHAGMHDIHRARAHRGITGAAKSVLASRKGVRKSGVDIDTAWEAMGRYERFQMLDALRVQILPVLVALPDVDVAPGTRPSLNEAGE